MSRYPILDEMYEAERKRLAGVSEWKTIDSAPRDGSEFLAYDPVAKKFDVCHMVPWVTGYACDAVQADGEYGPMEDEFQGRRATHWKDLPAPPL